ncbi:hypothetical protein AAE478_005424 [Parahypoxylon ruwenzoriense]
MQKILRRVATAERVAAKRAKAKDLKFYKKDKRERRQEDSYQYRGIRDELREAKKAVRDDWALGPLAPKRDIGDWAGAKGAIHETRYVARIPIHPNLRDQRCAWAGGSKNLNLAISDRVVLMDGPDKGRIGKIANIDAERAEVTVEGLNKSNIRVQPELRSDDDDDVAVVNLELPIPISSIRLVHPIRDPATGFTRDVIINRLTHAGLLYDRVSGRRYWSRVVPELNIAIPWPKMPEKDLKDYEGDTLRIDVEARTFVPTLLRPPIPEAVIDELRNKYSRFRTRHDPEYIARKEAEEQAVRDRYKLMDSMRTPLQELHRAERANKKKKGKPRLTIEMLEKIGEVMARNLERRANAGNLLPPTSSSSSPPAAPAEQGSESAPQESTSASTSESTSPPPSESTTAQETQPPPPPPSS